MTGLDDELAALHCMATTALREQWRAVWKQPPPQLGHDLLRRGLAWKLQAERHGGIVKPVERELDRLARQIARGGEIAFARTAKIGTRLVREWHGRTHHVMVTEDGYLYESGHYSSLTQIAFEITGTKWSGPRFFGLARRSRDMSVPPSEASHG